MVELPTINKTAVTVNTSIQIANDTVLSVVEALAIADAPFLGYPLVKPVFTAFLQWISGYIVKAAQTGATFAVIDTQVAGEENAISKAVTGVVTAEKSGDQNAINAAIKAYADAQSNLVHNDGSVSLP